MTSLDQLMDMHGSCAVITGATGGLGKIMSETLAELGYDLILVDINKSNLSSFESVLKEKWCVSIQSLVCDLENELERNKLIYDIKKNNSKISCLINNAAFVGASDLDHWITPFEDQSIEVWRRAIEVNLTAAFHLSQGLLSQLRINKGNIINITSIYGEFGPDWRLYADTSMGNPAAYGASKGGLAQFTRWLATTVAPDVRVNAISPGGVFRDQPELFVKRYENRTPLGRMAKEDDFRGAVAYLASNMSSYVTGHILRVDGGWGNW